MTTHLPSSAEPLVTVENLTVDFVSRDSTIRAVNGVSFNLMPGEVLCVIGESGSGKSVTMRSLMRLLPPKKAQIGGRVSVRGYDMLKMSEREISRLSGSEIAMIFQEPMTALDPSYTVGAQIAETVMRHRRCSRAQAMERALELLNLVRIPSPERRLAAYPHELSGGLRQRVMIAIALSCEPSLLLADEPTTALDATVQIQVLILLKRLQAEMGMGMMLVTHDLGVAAQIADRVAVMYAGRIVEQGSVQDVLMNPRHPYTRGMLASTVHGQDRDKDIDAIPGSPPDMRRIPPGCSFSPRCPRTRPECLERVPDFVSVAEGHAARCILLHEQKTGEARLLA